MLGLGSDCLPSCAHTLGGALHCSTEERKAGVAFYREEGQVSIAEVICLNLHKFCH